MSWLRTLTPLFTCILSSTGAAQPVADNWANARSLTVTLSSFQFEPSDIRLDHGVAYNLRLVNRSSGRHDFASPSFFAQAQLQAGDSAKVRNGRVALAGGDSVTIHLIAPAPGSYKVRCTHFMHGALGMTGRIVVQ